MSSYWLVVTGGAGAGRRIEIDGELVVGRESADTAFDDDEISRRHALFRVTDDRLSVEDGGSRNGTWLNGARIDTAVKLKRGDLIKVGRTTFRVEIESTGTVVSAPAPVPSGPTTPFAAGTVEARRGVATRDLRVEALTVTAVVSTAVATILYFALR